jgi:hypothetical protein
MRIEDVSSEISFLTLPGQDHDHEPAGSHILHVAAQMLEFLCRAQRAEQRSLKSSEKSMFRSGWVQSMQILFSAENVDLGFLETVT